MKVLIVVLLLFALSAPAAAQVPDAEEQAAAADQHAVRAVIDQLFDGMGAGDSSAVRATFAPQMRLMTVTMRNGEPVVLQTPADKFVAAVGSPHEEVWDERIWDVEIRVDGPLATAWVPYAFYVGDEFSHCGVNAFQFAELESGWKIIQVTDTRRKECVVPHAKLEETALEWASLINKKSPTAIRMLKYGFNLIADGLIGQQLFAGEATRLAYGTDEAQEGRDAFVEKREKDFSGFPWHY